MDISVILPSLIVLQNSLNKNEEVWAQTHSILIIKKEKNDF